MQNQIVFSVIFAAMLIMGAGINAAENASVDEHFVTKMIANVKGQSIWPRLFCRMVRMITFGRSRKRLSIPARKKLI